MLNSFTSLCPLRPDQDLLRTATVKTSVTLSSHCACVFMLYSCVALCVLQSRRKQQIKTSISSHFCVFVVLKAGTCRCLQSKERSQEPIRSPFGAGVEGRLQPVGKCGLFCCFIPLVICYFVVTSIWALVTV